MGSAELDGVSLEQVQALVAAGYRALEARRQEINDLNVYPVPDGDTGTNLSLTVKHVLDDLLAAPAGATAADVCTLVANAALMGARGNSGVILSQIVRGAVEPFADGNPASPPVIGLSLQRAAERAYAAVRRPVEGTMLTVVRELAEASAREAPDAHPGEFLTAVLEAGWESVRRTPTLLEVLADAGVVDAGGYGLMVLLEGMVHGTAVGGSVPLEYHEELARVPDRDAVVEEAVSPYTYCTSFLVTGSGLDPASLEMTLVPLGDSLLVVGDDRQVKVHVHTDDPGAVLGLATAMGTLHEVEIDNMKEQTAARDEHLRALADRREPVDSDSAATRTQVVAVVAGEGVKGLFRSLGATLFVNGGQSMNPSAQELLRAVNQAAAPAVVLLPNNRNIILTAEQVAHMAEREVVVVPTRSLQAGLSAMVAYDPQVDATANLGEMSDAVAHVVTGSVTSAVRDSVVDGLHVREGDFIGLVDDHVVASAEDLLSVAEAVLERLLDERREIVTLIAGDGSAPAEISRLVERLRLLYPDVELEVHDGGQPLYPLLLAAE